jgi:hypothetical protein
MDSKVSVTMILSFKNITTNYKQCFFYYHSILRYFLNTITNHRFLFSNTTPSRLFYLSRHYLGFVFFAVTKHNTWLFLCHPHCIQLLQHKLIMCYNTSWNKTWKNSPITSPRGLSIFICRYRKLLCLLTATKITVQIRHYFSC